MNYRCLDCNGWLFTISTCGMIQCNECYLGGYIEYKPNGEIEIGEE